MVIFLEENNEVNKSKIKSQNRSRVKGQGSISKTNFAKAIRILREEMYRKGWLVIDEIGPLELEGGGFCEVLKEILSKREGKILLVVRETLLEKVKEYFRIEEAQLITDVTLIKKLPG